MHELTLWITLQHRQATPHSIAKIIQAMVEIILGLQGDICVNSRNGVPFVAGK